MARARALGSDGGTAQGGGAFAREDDGMKSVADNKFERDQKRVAAGKAYEVAYFAMEHGLTPAQARMIIKARGARRPDPFGRR